jgi:N-acyl-D-aspartate/D-glutamate deacylase
VLAAALAVGAAGLGARAFQVAPSQAVPPATRAGLLVRGGLVVDGSGGPARRADVRVEGDVIVAVGPDLPLEPSERVLDASGLAVAPGFIDSHSHADRGLQAAPDAESQVRQGITTAIVGQDGASDLPIDEFYETIARVRPAINYATTVGHGTVRRLALGADFRRAATPSEIATMAALVDRAMADGALGLSSGLEYDPGASRSAASWPATAATTPATSATRRTGPSRPGGKGSTSAARRAFPSSCPTSSWGRSRSGDRPPQACASWRRPGATACV